MLLDKLLKDVKVEKKCENVDVKDIKIDSREVEKGDVFIALKGIEQDGNKFVLITNRERHFKTIFPKQRKLVRAKLIGFDKIKTDKFY